MFAAGQLEQTCQGSPSGVHERGLGMGSGSSVAEHNKGLAMA